MAKLIVSFMGIVNLVPDSGGTEYTAWIPDLRGRPHDMDHEPVLVVEKNNATWSGTLKPAGEDSARGLVSFSLHGETFEFGSSGGVKRMDPLIEHVLTVEDAALPTDPGHCRDFDPAALKPALTAKLLSGDLDACWMDDEYSWVWKKGSEKWLAEEVCLTTSHNGDEISLTFVNQGELTVKAGGSDDSIQIRIVNFPLVHLRNPHHHPGIDHHSVLYYEWSTRPVSRNWRLPLKGKKAKGNVTNHDHRFHGTTPVPLPPWVFPPHTDQQDRQARILLVGGTNCPPGDWYP